MLSIGFPEHVKKNVSYFIKVNGLERVINKLLMVFKKQLYSLANSEIICLSAPKPIINYTNNKQNNVYFRRNDGDFAVCSAIIIIQIMDLMMSKQKDNDVYPLPRAKKVCLNTEISNLIAMALVCSKNTDLKMEIINLL